MTERALVNDQELREIIEASIEQAFLKDLHLKRISFSYKDDTVRMQKIYEEDITIGGAR
jgi:hypothetical protein